MSLKIRILILFLLVAWHSFPLSSMVTKGKAANDLKGGIIYDFTLTVPPILEEIEKDSKKYNYFTNLTGLILSAKRGFPEVARFRVSFLVSADQNYNVQMINPNYKEYKLSQYYLPSKGVIYRNANPAVVPYAVSSASLKEATFYSGGSGMQKEYFCLRNVRGLTLEFPVVSVNQAEKKARVLLSARIILTPITATRVKAINSLSISDKRISSELMEFLPDLFANYESPKRWGHELDDGLGDLLVIYTARDAEAIKPYIEHKTRLGFKVKSILVRPGTNVGNSGLIKNEYKANPKLLYVQLVGDWEDIQCDMYKEKDEQGNPNNGPMDNWLGAVSGDDNYLDLCVGRFCCKNANQVKNQVAKTIAYEEIPVGSRSKNALGIGSAEGNSEYSDDREADKQHIAVILDNKLVPKGFKKACEVYDPGALKQLISKAVNDGVDIINYCGHGGSDCWVTSGFSNNDVKELKNSKLPVIISVACLNGTYYLEETCFAEEWMRKVNGGAVAALMATISLPWSPPMRSQDYINDMIVGGYNYSSNPGDGTDTIHGKTRLGPIVFNAFNLQYAEQGLGELSTIKTWMIFGDVTLQIVPDRNK